MGYEINPAHSVSARERILDESFFFDLFFLSCLERQAGGRPGTIGYMPA